MSLSAPNGGALSLRAFCINTLITFRSYLGASKHVCSDIYSFYAVSPPSSPTTTEMQMAVESIHVHQWMQATLETSPWSSWSPC